MNTVFMERDIRRVSLAFRAYDSFDGDSVIASGVEVYLGGVVQKPIHTREGYILYMDLPDGTYAVTASGRYYDYFDPLSIDTTTFDPRAGVVELPMRPRVDYPFPDSATLLKGVIKDQSDNPVSGARVDLVNSTDYAITDASGRYVFFFQPEYPNTDVSISVSASGYEGETLNTTVVEGDTVYLDATIVALSSPDVAIISGLVRDTSGNPVTQAKAEIVGTGISTLTDASGRCILAKNISSSPETISIRITQDGYAEKTINLSVVAGQTTSFVATLNLQVLMQTCTIDVSVEKEHHHKLGGVLVEVLEKNRSGYTNSSQGEVVFYENSILAGGERATLRMSLAGFVTRIESVMLYPGQLTRVTYNLISI